MKATSKHLLLFHTDFFLYVLLPRNIFLTGPISLHLFPIKLVHFFPLRLLVSLCPVIPPELWLLMKSASKLCWTTGHLFYQIHILDCVPLQVILKNVTPFY